MNNDYNVSDQDVYPQFMDNNNNMAEVTPDEDYGKTGTSSLASLFRFLAALFRFLTGFFKGEISLSIK